MCLSTQSLMQCIYMKRERERERERESEEEEESIIPRNLQAMIQQTEISAPAR